MYHQVLYKIFFVLYLNAISIILTGCFPPIEVERDAEPNIKVWDKELLMLPDEQVFAVEMNHLSISAVINEMKKSYPGIEIADVERFQNLIGTNSDGLRLPDVATHFRTHVSNHSKDEVLVAIEAESLGMYRFGIPPYDLRTGAYVVELSAIVVPHDINKPFTEINAKVIVGGSAFLFPLPVVIETVDELEPHERAKRVLGQEIGRFLNNYYESKPLKITIMWLSAEGIMRKRQFDGCTGTWEEIKKCSEYNK